MPTRKRKQIKCVFAHVSFTFSRQNQDLRHFLRKKLNKKEIRRYSKRSSMKIWKDLKLGGLDKESRTIHLSYVAVERERDTCKVSRMWPILVWWSWWEWRLQHEQNYNTIVNHAFDMERYIKKYQWDVNSFVHVKETNLNKHFRKVVLLAQRFQIPLL